MTESVLLMKLGKVLDAWPLCPPQNEDDYRAGSVLFVNQNNTFTPTRQHMINCVEQRNEDQIHLGVCQGFGATVGLSIAANEVKAGVGGSDASSPSSVHIALHDRICERIPRGDILGGVDRLFFHFCIKEAQDSKTAPKLPGEWGRISGLCSCYKSSRGISEILVGAVSVDCEDRSGFP
jgi:hypothetical protein